MNLGKSRGAIEIVYFKCVFAFVSFNTPFDSVDCISYTKIYSWTWYALITTISTFWRENFGTVRHWYVLLVLLHRYRERSERIADYWSRPQAKIWPTFFLASFQTGNRFWCLLDIHRDNWWGHLFQCSVRQNEIIFCKSIWMAFKATTRMEVLLSQCGGRGRLFGFP